MSGREETRAAGLARGALFGLMLVLVGVGVQRMPGATPGRQYWPWVLAAGIVVWVLVAGLWWRSRSGSANVVRRWSARSNRNHGVASRWQIFKISSSVAMRRRATVLRPSLREVSWWRRARTPVRELATPLARVGRQRIWSPVEDVTVRIGGPRTGKTGELAGRILDGPGAVIATSTRTDLIELTARVRSAMGPVHVFNPAGVGQLASTIVFDPLTGCAKPAAATARASDLLAGVSGPADAFGGDREWWTSQARRALAALLHAAALGGAGMSDVLAWVADPEDASGDIARFLRRSPSSAFEADAAQFLGTNDRTRSSITTTIMPALGWLTDETAAAAAGVNAPPGSVADFNVAGLLDSRATVYMLGAEDANTAPLLTALTGHLAREARRIARDQPWGRLDPPLTMALDEAAIIAPIPLDKWTADMGGNNITIHIACQSRAQLRQRWAETGAAAILNNAATILLYGGTRDADDLGAYSQLIGDRDEQVATYDKDGETVSTTVRRVPVLSAAQISQLPAKHVVIIRRGMPPAVGTVKMAWRRRDVRAAARRARRADRYAAWATGWGNAKATVAEVSAAWASELADRSSRAAEIRAAFRRYGSPEQTAEDATGDDPGGRPRGWDGA